MFYNIKLYLLIVTVSLLASCSSTDTPKTTVGADTATLKKEYAPIINSNGSLIRFSEKDSSQSILEIDSAQLRDVSVTTTSPARIVFSTTSFEGGSFVIPVFESNDLTQLYTDYSKALNDEARSKREIERLKDLFMHNAIAGKEVIQAEGDLRTIQVALTGYQSRLLQSGLEPSDLQTLRSNTSLMIANVPESGIWTVQKGEDAQIEFDSYKGEILHGKVIDIGKTLDPATRTFNVRVNISETKHTLRPGMFAKVSFGKDIATKFVIPASSVISVQGKSYVFVQRAPRTYERREVNLGSQSGDWFIVLSGIERGERVVGRGSVLLKGLSFGS